MYRNNVENKINDKDIELFNKFKERLLIMSDEYDDVPGVRLFIKKIEQAESFDDFSKKL